MYFYIMYTFILYTIIMRSSTHSRSSVMGNPFYSEACINKETVMIKQSQLKEQRLPIPALDYKCGSVFMSLPLSY